MLDDSAAKVIESTLVRIEKTESAWGRTHPKLVKELFSLADLYMVLGDPVNAKPIYWRILDIQQGGKAPINANSVETLLSLAEVYEAEGNLSVAEQLYNAALGHSYIHPVTVAFELRVLMKLYGIYSITRNDEKLLDIEKRLFVFLQKYETQTARTPANTVEVSSNRPSERSSTAAVTRELVTGAGLVADYALNRLANNLQDPNKEFEIQSHKEQEAKFWAVAS